MRMCPVAPRSSSFKDPLLYDTKLTREGEKQARTLRVPSPLAAALTPCFAPSEGVVVGQPRRNALPGAAAAGVFAAAPRAAHRGAGVCSRAAAARAAAAGHAALPRALVSLLRRRPCTRHHRRGASHLVRGMRVSCAFGVSAASMPRSPASDACLLRCRGGFDELEPIWWHGNGDDDPLAHPPEPEGAHARLVCTADRQQYSC